MGEATPDLTERYLVRSAHYAQLLRIHLEGSDERILAGRAKAAEAILDNALRDWRRWQADIAQAKRRRQAMRNKPVQEYHCGR
jgi:hypothetical protein